MKENIINKIILVEVIIIILAVIILLYFNILQVEVMNTIILMVTAMIIFWYTFETNKIRKFEQERISFLKRPIINFNLFQNQKKPSDLRLRIINSSNNSVSCLVKLTAKINNENINISIPGYFGDKYWNLPYMYKPEGHFDLRDMLKMSGIFSATEMNNINETNPRTVINSIKDLLKEKFSIHSVSEINFSVEILSFNEYGNFINYLPKKYNFSFKKHLLIPEITYNEPHFDFNKIPEWVDSEFIKKYLKK